MEQIDILVPYKHSRKRRIPFFKYSLFDGMANRDWYPLLINRTNFLDYGYRFRFFTPNNIPSRSTSSCIFIDSRIKDGKKIKWDDVKIMIRKFKQEGKKVVLFDNKDSHNILMELLPEVDYYMKKQLLKNRSHYKKVLDGGRLFTDFYSKINKGELWDPSQNQPSNYKSIFTNNQHKLMVSWNILLAVDQFDSFRDYLRFAFLKDESLCYTSPNHSREVVLNANFSTGYKNSLVAQQRIQLKSFLEDFKWVKDNSIGYVEKNNYINNLKKSKAVVSPFGWGEVCYRDFEAFVYGNALLKPNMDHLETWPNLYQKNDTYIPISWDPNKWKDEFQEILSKDNLIFKVAKKGQNSYKELWSENGKHEFCKRLSSKLDDILFG